MNTYWNSTMSKPLERNSTRLLLSFTACLDWPVALSVLGNSALMSARDGTEWHLIFKERNIWIRRYYSRLASSGNNTLVILLFDSFFGFISSDFHLATRAEGVPSVRLWNSSKNIVWFSTAVVCLCLVLGTKKKKGYSGVYETVCSRCTYSGQLSSIPIAKPILKWVMMIPMVHLAGACGKLVHSCPYTFTPFSIGLAAVGFEI